MRVGLMRVTEEKPNVRTVMLPDGNTAIADIAGELEVGGIRYSLMWFPLIDSAENGVVQMFPFRLIGTEPYIVGEIQSPAEAEKVWAAFKESLETKEEGK